MLTSSKNGVTMIHTLSIKATYGMHFLH